MRVFLWGDASESFFGFLNMSADCFLVFQTVIIAIGKINVDENPELAGQFGVMSIPTLVVMKNGKIVNQSMGAKSKSAILAML